jgi:hypothetical protein
MKVGGFNIIMLWWIQFAERIAWSSHAQLLKVLKALLNNWAFTMFLNPHKL